MEKNLNFVGLIVMENKLKPETTPVIKELREANIRCIMVTGEFKGGFCVIFDIKFCIYCVSYTFSQKCTGTLRPFIYRHMHNTDKTNEKMFTKKSYHSKNLLINVLSYIFFIT